jgi:hypothetical protein
MKALPVLDEIYRHIDSASRLIDWANTDVAFGGPDDPEAAGHLRQAYEHLGAAKALVAEHRPTVRYQTVHEGALVELDPGSPTEWVRIWDESKGRHASVRWSEIGATA